MTVEVPKASLNNPFLEQQEMEFTVPGQASYQPGLYEEKLKQGFELMQKPFQAAGEANTQKQHLKNRMTIWERIGVLSTKPPTILFQNWGENLDGASLVTAIIDIDLSLIHI